MKTINIFGVHILNITMQKALDLISEAIQNSEQRKIYFVNADCLNKAYLDDDYHLILNKTKYIFGDGSGVRIASKMVGTPILDNVNGTDMLPLLCRQCVAQNHKIFLLGAKPGVSQTMKQNLENKYPGIMIAGNQHGYFDRKDNDKLIEKINDTNADILLVAFGAPSQETWIHENAEKLKCKVLIGVGGLFDFYSGNMPRAPLWMRKLGIEWIFRLYKEPGRMWRRYIVGNPVFINRVKKWKMKRVRGSK